MNNETTLCRLQKWYAAHCDGDWEHSWGVKIDTLDNPGWSIFIDLHDTELEKVSFMGLKVDHPTGWMFCEVKGGQFLGRCGPEKLESMIEVFLKWAEEQKK
jgi:hypothetical protein